MNLLGQYEIPHNYLFKNTTVGGLSGIDYDKGTDLYNMISDDRSAINPARYYSAKIFTSQKGIDSVKLEDVHFLRQPNGQLYPNSQTNPLLTPDPEAIRFNPLENNLTWSSEGERIITAGDTVLEDPSINVVSVEGNWLASYQIPDNLKMQLTEQGPRQNSVFEGMSFADNFKTLYVSVEEPLYQDGPRADIYENNAWIRILKFNEGSKSNTAQYAYKLDPIARPPFPASGFKINGVSDILAIDDHQLLVIERSFSSGRFASTIKVFLVDLTGSTDIKDIASLKENTSFKPLSKKLLLNMDNLGIYIDNIEGVTFGPNLPNGHRTLLFIADNNFQSFEKTQILFFEVIE